MLYKLLFFVKNSDDFIFFTNNFNVILYCNEISQLLFIDRQICLTYTFIKAKVFAKLFLFDVLSQIMRIEQ